MQCKNCGTFNAENSKFCKKCGMAIEGAVVDTNNKKVEKNKKRVPGKLIVIAFIVLIVSGIFFFIKGNKTKVYNVENTIKSYVGTENNQTYIVNTNNKAVVGDIRDNIGWIDSSYSMNGEKGVYLLSDNRLIMVENTDVIEIAEEVQSFTLADGGNMIAYCDMDNTLFIYDCESMLTEKIANRVSTDNFRLSPQGKAVAYVDQESESKLCVYFNHEICEIGKDLFPIAIPDSAEYIYCYNTQNDGIYVKYLNGESKKLATNDGWIFNLNKEHTQLQFLSNDSWYVSEEGKDKIRLFDNCDSATYMPVPLTGYVLEAMSNGRMGTLSKGVSDLSDAFYISSDSNGISDLYYVDNEWNSELIEENITVIKIDKTGKDVCYLKENRLFKIEDGKYKNPFWVTDNVTNFAMTSDGEAIYYIDEDETLWYKKGREEGKRIADEVSNKNLYITYDDYVLFLTDYSNESGILYSSYQGKEKERIADDVSEVIVTNKFTEYRTNYDYESGTSDLYGANKKTEFTLILENVY